MPRHDGGIVAKAAVAVDFTPVGEDPFDVVQGIGALRMSGQFGLLPGVVIRRDLDTQGVDAIMQLLDLVAEIVVLSRRGFQPGQLLLDFLQFLSRLEL